MSMTGGALVVETLLRLGVGRVFALHGGHIDSVFQAALDGGLEIVDTRHEAAAGHAAEGYARVTGGLGVALVTAGGGFTNAVTSMANAYLDRTPVLYLTASGALGDDETNTLQAGIDQVAIATPITKWAHRVVSTDHIPRLIEQAVRVATTGPRGPVLLDFPWNVLVAKVDAEAIPAAGAAVRSTPAAPDGETIAQIEAMFSAAQRPVVIIGSEAARCG
jgi:acetolactate synthase-1/2/3 large subunit